MTVAGRHGLSDGEDRNSRQRGPDRFLRAFFATVARTRRARVLHPVGAVFDAELQVFGTDGTPTEAPLLDEPGRYRCVVRLSKAVGTPQGVPDLLGMAVRIPADEFTGQVDLLFTTCGSGRLTRYVPVPRGSADSGAYSSLLSYRTPRGPLMLAMLPEPLRGADTAAGSDRGEQGPAQLVFGLAAARPGGAWRPVGRLTLRRRTPGAPAGHVDRLMYDPHRYAADGLALTGMVHRMRRSAYAGSREGRLIRPPRHPD